MEIRLLGPVEARVDGVALPLRRRQERCLLSILALEPGRFVPVERLTDLLWDECPPQRSRPAIQAMVSHLRSAISGTASPDARIHASSGGYTLDIEPDSVDLHRFRALVDEAGRTSYAGQRAKLLREALGLWRGEALADAGDERLRARLCPDLDESRAVAYEDWLDSRLELGENGPAATELIRLIEVHPLRERLRGQLMIALYRSGQRAEAREVYRQTRQILVDELGLEPGPPLRRLERQILTDDPALSPGTRGTTVSRNVPAQLPLEPAGFTGREQAMGELDALVVGRSDRQATVPLAAIAGCPGVGKTALAVHWAHRVGHRFPDGQLYLDLNGYAATAPTQPLEALTQLLHGLGTPTDQIPVDVAQAAAAYRTLLAGSRTLILLDNALSAEQVRPLLPGSPTCLVLVTSRERLTGLVAREGATRVTLEVLSPDEAGELLARVLGDDRVRAEPDAAADLARICGYLPLALRVVAAHLVDRPGRSLAEHVSALQGGDRISNLRVVDDPQAAVGAAFDLSYQSLAGPARRLFRLLGLLPGMTLAAPAVAALLGTTADRAHDLLERLSGAHLLTQPEPGRYALHDLLRHYAAHRAERTDRPASRAAATARLFQWYLERADQAVETLHPHALRAFREPGTTPPAAPGQAGSPAGAMAWLERERRNLLAVIRLAAAQGPHHVSWQLVDALREYFWRAGHTFDWVHAGQLGLEAATREGDLTARAASMLNLGMAHQRARQNQVALEHCRSAVLLSEQAQWLGGMATALNCLGNIHLLLGDVREAKACHRRALEIYQRTGQHRVQAAVLINIGSANHHLGRLTEARDCRIAALALYESGDFRSGQAEALANLGYAECALGRLSSARTHLETALRLHREAGNHLGEAATLHDLAEVQRDCGELESARATGEAALAIATEVNGQLISVYIHNLLGTVHLRLGQLDAAHEHHQVAVQTADAIEARYPHTCSLLGLAAVAHHDGRHPQARVYAEQALQSARRFGYAALAEQALACLADASLVAG